MPAPRVPGSEQKILKKIDDNKIIREQVAAYDALQTSDVHFSIGRELARGSFGVVLEAMNQTTGEMVAMKRIPRPCSKDPKSEQQFKALKAELNMMKKLRHPNIVSFLGWDQQEEHFYLIMELVPGRSIADMLKTIGAFHEAVVKKFTKQILHALEYCHGVNCVHRDIKGLNILLSTTGQIKLCDLGSAKLRDVAEDGTVSQMTESYCFTPLWVAPEALSTNFYNEKVDIYALGCVVIEMASGPDLWAEKNWKNRNQALLYIATHDEIPRIPDTLSELAQDFTRKCLDRNPDRRWSASQLLEHPWITGGTATADALSPGGANHLTSSVASSVLTGSAKAQMEQMAELVETSASTALLDSNEFRPADSGIGRGVVVQAVDTTGMSGTVQHTHSQAQPFTSGGSAAANAMLPVSSREGTVSMGVNGNDSTGYQMPLPSLMSTHRPDSERPPQPLHSPSAYGMNGRPEKGLGASGAFNVHYSFDGPAGASHQHAEEGVGVPMNMSLASTASDAISSPGALHVSVGSTTSSSSSHTDDSRNEGSLGGSRVFLYQPAESGSGSGSISETYRAGDLDADGDSNSSMSLTSSVLSFVDCQPFRLATNDQQPGNTAAGEVQEGDGKRTKTTFIPS